MPEQPNEWWDASNHNWTTPEAWSAALADAKAEGFTGVIVDLYGDNAKTMLSMAHDAGFRLAGYVYLNFPGGDYYAGIRANDQVGVALIAAGGAELEFLAIDCEDPKNNLNQADTIAWISDAAHACDGKIDSIIYTAPAWWRLNTGDTEQFKDWRLWLANPTGVKPTTFALPSPFGGWTAAFIIQYDWHGRIDDALPEVDLDLEDPSQEPAQQGGTEVPAKLIPAEGTQDIGLLNSVAIKALGALAAGDQSQGERAAVCYGPDLALGLGVGEEALVLVVPQGTFHVGQ